jgi:hypothetical protein
MGWHGTDSLASDRVREERYESMDGNVFDLREGFSAQFDTRKSDLY